MSEKGSDATHLVTVLRVADLNPGLRRVTFGGPGLEGWTSTGSPDEYFRLVFPAPGEELPQVPQVVGGNLDYSSIDMSRMRTYTVRAHDTAEASVDVDFVIHEGGVAATWARQAAAGQQVVCNRPEAMYAAPPALEWQILVADLAGLPALCRIVEATPRQVQIRAVVEVPDEEHRLDLPQHPLLDITWVVGGNGRGPSRLEQVVRSLPRPDGVGYTWVAGEARVLRAVRAHLRKELKLPTTAYKTVGYWVENGEEWEARFEALPEDVRTRLESMWEGDRDPEEIEDEYDAELTRLGL
ncbi:MAG TPA: siderophore-interacting protein [Nocardioides sp.]|nr:siderophore-interacting protein [Nocardioides sp.]